MMGLLLEHLGGSYRRWLEPKSWLDAFSEKPQGVAFLSGRITPKGAHGEPGGSSDKHSNLGVIKSCSLEN